MLVGNKKEEEAVIILHLISDVFFSLLHSIWREKKSCFILISLWLIRKSWFDGTREVYWLQIYSFHASRNLVLMSPVAWMEDCWAGSNSFIFPLSKVERKRHIGNDIVTIVFQEGDDALSSFKPSMIRSHFTRILHMDGCLRHAVVIRPSWHQ